MKATIENTYINTEDEFSGLYNWSERTAVFLHRKKSQIQVQLSSTILDLVCMAAITFALVTCL